MKVSICIPWIRELKFERCVNMIEENAGYPFEMVAEEDKKRIGCPKMLKRLVDRSEGDLVVFLGDDTLPLTDFLSNAVLHMKKFPDQCGLVGFNDQTGRVLPTHWLASKKLLPMLDGEFFHTGYNHCCCDQELLYRTHEKGLFIYAKDAIVLHDHPILTGQQTSDPDYLRVYSDAVRGPDQRLLAKRKANGWKTPKGE